MKVPIHCVWSEIMFKISTLYHSIFLLFLKIKIVISYYQLYKPIDALNCIK